MREINTILLAKARGVQYDQQLLSETEIANCMLNRTSMVGWAHEYNRLFVQSLVCSIFPSTNDTVK